MADRRASKSARPRTAPLRRRLTASEFKSAPEFGHFKTVMRRVIAVPKSELDAMVRASKKQSSRSRKRQ